MTIVEAVVHHLPFPAIFDQSCLLEQAKLVGDRRTGGPQKGGEVTNAQLLGGQGLDDPQAPRVPQKPKHLRSHLKIFDGGKTGLDPIEAILMQDGTLAGIIGHEELLRLN